MLGSAIHQRQGSSAFTLVELLVVVAVIATLASLLLPAIARAKGRGQQIYCGNNMRQLTMASALYAQDNNDRFPYNLGATQIKSMLDQGQSFNWAGSLLNWELDSSNTNLALNTHASLGSYIAHKAGAFRCPSDTVLSGIQRDARWSARSRTFSMNLMVGDAGDFSSGGTNINNPSYRQYLKMSDVTLPESIFQFIEEHPDSINDGYFVNRAYRWEWIDLPASHHAGGADLTYVDGHLELKRWLRDTTKKPSVPDGAMLPFSLAPDDWADFDWLMARMSTH
jgi:prepilin-type N-terminal cleavage/methylation domain-containing protein